MKSYSLPLRLAALGLATAMVIPALAATPAFTDVPEDAWFAQYVQDAATMGIVSGYKDTAGNLTGYFGPGDSVSVAQILKMEIGVAGIKPDLYRIVPSPIYRRSPGDPGYYEQQWWYKYYLIAKEQKVNISGCSFTGFGNSSGDLGPNRPIRRWEMARLLSDLYLQPEDFAEPLSNPYIDIAIEVETVGDVIASPAQDTPIEWSKLEFTLNEEQNRNAILKLTKDGVLTGDRNLLGKRMFRPMDTLNRAEAVKILLKAQETYPGLRVAVPESFDLPDLPPMPCTA